MVVNTNIAAASSSRLLAESNSNLARSLTRLSSGARIVAPQDDAAGLSQSLKFDAQIGRNDAARVNVGNAVSFSQTQDGFLQKVQVALDRMSTLSVLAKDVTKTNTDRSNYSVEFMQLQNYISDIGTKSFNDVTLFSSTQQAVTIDSDASVFSMNAINLQSTTAGTGLGTAFSNGDSSVTSSAAAGTALSNISTAIQALADMRAKVGANIQRLSLTDEQLSIYNENLSAANSRIKDVNVAEESTQYARYNILVQSGTAMLAQANVLPQSALRLIQ